jgi:hypothetical protein
LCASEVKEVIFAQGHPNILATHRTTLEITKETSLSKKGDCIVAVAAEKALADLSAEFKETLKEPGATLTVFIETYGLSEQVEAQGSPKLILNHPTEMVIRKSDYISNRTLAIQANKAAKDLSRTLVERLKDPKQKVKITLIARV